MSQIPILTITMNPALDIATEVAEVTAGPKLRCSMPQVDPGGGGINVSRAIAALGGSSRAMVALGGTTGMRLALRVAHVGIALDAFAAPGETRQSLAVTETSTGRQYRFVLPGEKWLHTQIDSILERISVAALQGGFIVLSGSMPPGVPSDFVHSLAGRIDLAQLLGEQAGHKPRLVVDTSGAPLERLISEPTEGLHTLRMDDEEAEEIAGFALTERKDTADFASKLVAAGVAENVIVARGADGSVLANKSGRIFANAAKVTVVSKVGAGDSFVGAYVLALAEGKNMEKALARGVAAASAAVMTEATDLCHRDDTERLLPECKVIKV
ncbi:1-phosphofructokinase family hexose kinase [Rhodobacter ferrooxidans]|uniref:Phosphofructokinase n=1 Tax=Rhodobacter ferrooxidans TaxID=371731 RepID=C8S018_9RHOB|nr:hexose kinase [Rhodobacter sp. SW2]EEW25627.1 1-phosphofructokinase [Rhodobacter sp. SW2]